MKSLIIEIALQTFVPAGGALAVDRNRFAQMITQRIMSHPNIEVKTEECTSLPEGIVIIATGPLSSEPMVDVLTKMTKSENLSFMMLQHRL